MPNIKNMNLHLSKVIFVKLPIVIPSRIIVIITISLAIIICTQYASAQEIDTVQVISYKIKGRTATGQQTYKIKVPFVAVSRDLLKKYPLNSIIELYNCRWAGEYHVLDIMGRRHTKTVDVFYKGKSKNQVPCNCRKALK